MKTGWIPFEKSESGGAAQAGESKQIPDTFKDAYGVYDLIPYPVGQEPAKLRKLVKQSSILPQCNLAYKQNVTGFGRGLRYKANESDKTGQDEWERAEEMLETVVLDKPLESFLGELVDDLNEGGNAYIEVSRDGGLPALFRMNPDNVRCSKEAKKVKVEYKRLYKNQVKTYTQVRWVRKYAQMVGQDIVWYREFGVKQEEFPESQNEIIHLKIGQNGAYGEPFWIGNTPGVVGTRNAETLNVDYFDNGRMLSMILTIINGELTNASIESLKATKGRPSQGGILVLEAIGYEKGNGAKDEKEKTEIKLDKLNDLLQQDALFLEYVKEKRQDVLSSFRLPPIYIGRSDDYNLATSNTARRIAEEQVFIPLRNWLMDEIFNYRLFPAYDIYRVEAFLRGPKIVDPDERKQLLDYLADRGIMLVSHLIPIAEEVLNTTIDEKKYSKEYLDTPIAQLFNQPQFPLPSGDDVQEKVVSIAKRLLRQSEAEAGIHV
ncbi:phage portal protein [Aneurinibacillus aneurinilyticus]|jgi:PBSX family phage portal protein|uniref:phage portal protein n=1 Tax=Aneurinibacillus aneurinilyticus TaxID=1391 RepID=UPI0023F9C5BD|nr:phage portal protein [Aneurinibacillus aneurinilyticus]MCI1696891.1 phage portal protein [Aneurinibacillus aneurinilyticus]